MSRAKLAPQPIYRLLALGFVLVALLPLALLIAYVYQAAWQNAWREIAEKHQLLAQNLAAPMRIYVTDHREMLGQLADEVAHRRRSGEGDAEVRRLLVSAFSHLKGFESLTLLSPTGQTQVLAHRDAELVTNPLLYAEEACFVHTRDSGTWAISNIKRSPITGGPTIIMSQPLVGGDGALLGVLLGELRIELIEDLRKSIRFGKEGHSAIVDKRGRVIAHPNPEWMREMHDLSDLSIVKRMMAGGTGVAEFYSPFIEAQMVAGYATVPEIGWGIMVPQPRSEVEAQVATIVNSHLFAGVLGLALAIAVAIPLARWITRPINKLANATLQLARSDFNMDLPPIGPRAPREVKQLDKSIRQLIEDFRCSRSEVRELNHGLQTRVDNATRELRDANARLEILAQRDHLTNLPNRRHFETTLGNQLTRRDDDPFDGCILLIDVDNFKEINDALGHAAGDHVLRQLAALLEGRMRAGDIVARYGGDEFVARLHCDRSVGLKRAGELRSEIERHNFKWEGEAVRVTVSIGLLYSESLTGADVETLLSHADSAMYAAKRKGRNRVVDLAVS